MMKKDKTPPRKLFRMAYIIPVISILLYAFAEPEYVSEQAPNPQPSLKITAEDSPSLFSDQEEMATPPSEKSVTVTGKVLDENGNPVPKATIAEINSKGQIYSGTLSKDDGSFKITCRRSGKTALQVRHVAYRPTYLFVDLERNESPTAKLQRNVFSIVSEAKILKIEQLKPPPPPPPLDNSTEPEPKVDDEHVFMIVEQMPSFKGGYADLNKTLQKKLEEWFFSADKHPTRQEGVVGFTVSETGKVVNAKIIGEENDAAKDLLEIGQNMPDWNPGKQRTTPVPVDYMLKYTF